VDPKTTLLQHFENLSKVYPLEAFEKNMSDFIKMLLEDMDIPALDKVTKLTQQAASKKKGFCVP
jgi:hypothetical protein